MKSLYRFAMVAASPLALAACGDSPPDEPPPLEPMAQEMPADADPGMMPEIPEETVVEVEPEISGTEPMDSAVPMDDTAPMTDDFGSEDSMPGDNGN